MTKLDQKFWKSFAKNTWEKKSISLKNVQSPLQQMDAKEIFTLLVRFADRCRKLKDSEGFKFYVDGQKMFEDEVLDVLPEKSDKSLEGYHKRMNEIFEDYCLVCDELLQVNADKQALLSQFTKELYQQVGFPNRFAEMGLYLGNYRKTPFGVHVDGCGVFSFPVVGHKKFRIWEPEFVKKNPALDRAFKYDKFKKNSQLLTASAGDMTYWPSSAWHIAESDGNFSATWSLGVWIDRPHRESLVEVLNEVISSALGKDAELGMTAFKELHDKDGQVGELPKAYQKSLKALKSLTEKELEASFKKQWMKHISKQGFKTIPQTESSEPIGKNLQLRSPESPILWQVSGSQLICGFAGTLIETKKSKAMLNLLKALNTGEACKLNDFLSKKEAGQVQECLRKLSNVGAFK